MVHSWRLPELASAVEAQHLPGAGILEGAASAPRPQRATSLSSVQPAQKSCGRLVASSEAAARRPVLRAGSRTSWSWRASPAEPGSSASAQGPCANTRASADVPWAGTPAGRACGSLRPPAGRPRGWTYLWGAGQEAAGSGGPVPTYPVPPCPLKVTPHFGPPFPGKLRSRAPVSNARPWTARAPRMVSR